MILFQREIENANLFAWSTLKNELCGLFKSTELTLSIIEGSYHLGVNDAICEVLGSETFLVGSLYCNHSISYMQLLGVSAKVITKQYSHPKQLVTEALTGFKKRLKSSIYMMVYTPLRYLNDKENYESQLIIGIQLLDRIIIKAVPIAGTGKEIKEKSAFIALTYLKNYLSLYKKSDASMPQTMAELPIELAIES